MFLFLVVFVKKLFSKGTDPAFSLVSSPEFLLNKLAIVAKGKPRCKCAELHCQVCRTALPNVQNCTAKYAVLPYQLGSSAQVHYSVLGGGAFFRFVFQSKSDMAAG